MAWTARVRAGWMARMSELDDNDDSGRIRVRGQIAATDVLGRIRGPRLLVDEHDHDWGEWVGVEWKGMGKRGALFEVWECIGDYDGLPCHVRIAKQLGWERRELEVAELRRVTGELIRGIA